MSDTVAVIIGTFGDMMEWAPFVQRASASVEAQTHLPDFVVWKHADTLQHARNYGAGDVTNADWFIFLDADDELEPTYIEEMLKGEGDIRRPSTRGIYEDGSIEDPPSLIPERDLYVANYIVIGAMVRASMFFDVDGFDDYPILEDWALWLKLFHHQNATITAVPAAVYRIHVRGGSRNTEPEHQAVYQIIRQRFVR